MKDNYLTHLSILVVGILIAGYFFVYFKFNPGAQIVIAALGCIYYVVWGIIHHATKGRLSKLIILEYLLVGSLIFLLFFTTLSM